MRENMTLREFIDMTKIATGRDEDQIMETPIKELMGKGKNKGSIGKVKTSKMQGFNRKR